MYTRRNFFLFSACASVAILQLLFTTPSINESFTSFVAGVFFTPSITNERLAETYALAKEPSARKVNILIIPGHDDASPGTAYNGLKEKDVNLAVAKELVEVFKGDPLFKTTLARDETGYNQTLVPQLLNTEDTANFRASYKAVMESLIANGEIERTSGVFHNDALPETALRLYALNKWANENNFDLIINIHFNDYSRKNRTQGGKYSGFAIYVPEKQYSNALPSKEIGNHIKSALEKIFLVSNHPQESAGVVEDQELIAIGAYNTLNPAVVLIEYDYIYAPILQHEEVRALAIKKYAQETYNGIKNYFEKQTGAGNNERRHAVMLHEFTKEQKRGPGESPETFLLQLALARAGVFPPPQFNPHDCPLSGKFGECTETAVKQFQKKYSISETGIVGEKTREAMMPFTRAL